MGVPPKEARGGRLSPEETQAKRAAAAGKAQSERPKSRAKGGGWGEHREWVKGWTKGWGEKDKKRGSAQGEV